MFELTLYNTTKDGQTRVINKEFDTAYDMSKFYIRMRPPKKKRKEDKSQKGQKNIKDTRLVVKENFASFAESPEDGV